MINIIIKKYVSKFAFRVKGALKDKLLIKIKQKCFAFSKLHWGTFLFFFHVNEMSLGVFEKFFRSGHESGFKSCLSRFRVDVDVFGHLRMYYDKPWRPRTFEKVSNWSLTFLLSNPCVRKMLTYDLEARNATKLNLEKITSWKLGLGVTLETTHKLINPTCCISK